MGGGSSIVETTWSSVGFDPLPPSAMYSVYAWLSKKVKHRMLTE